MGKAREREGAHSSTTLHYVRHFPEDSLGSENREDVGKKWGRRARETRGGGQINTWLNRPENSFHPSGVSYGAYLQPQPHRRANDAPERARAVLFRDFPRAILRLDRCRVYGITPRRETVRDERWKYWNVIGTRDSLSVIRSSRGINASRRISIDVAYVTSYLNGDTRSWDGRRKIISNFSLTINCLLHSPSIEEETASSLERERKCSHVFFLLGEIYYLEFFLVINLLPRDH